MEFPAGVWMLTAVLTVIGCQTNDAEPDASPKTPPATVTVTIDSPDLHYLYRGSDGRTHSTTTLADVPSVRRRAVMVYDETAMPHAARGSDVYVADLTEAGPGDTRRAVRRPRNAVAARHTAIDAAFEAGSSTAAMAREWAKLHPASERTAASRKAREELDKMLPDETDAGESSSANDPTPSNRPSATETPK